MKSDSYKISLRFEQILELVRQLSSEEQAKLYEELENNQGISISTAIADREIYTINGVTVYKGDSNIDTKELEDIFSRNVVESKQLREKAWARK